MENLVSIQEYINQTNRKIPTDTEIPIGTKIHFIDNEDGSITSTGILARITNDSAKVIDINTGEPKSHCMSAGLKGVKIPILHVNVPYNSGNVNLKHSINGENNLQKLYYMVQNTRIDAKQFHIGDQFVYGHTPYILVKICDTWALINKDNGEMFKNSKLAKPDANMIDLSDLTRLLNNRPDSLKKMQHVAHKRD